MLEQTRRHYYNIITLLYSYVGMYVFIDEISTTSYIRILHI